MTEFSETYRKKKADFDSIEGIAMQKVSRVWREYARQKDAVSTGFRAVPWQRFSVASFKIGETHVRVKVQGYGQYGYSDQQQLRFPCAWLELDDSGLIEAVQGRIRAEGEDIARREAAAAAKKTAAVEAEERAELARLQAKYAG
ncbi:hypothetical protein [Salipiger sp. PrR003]|uniref:hypothetical protein n=1 Tax=Salipiger sp. PrR003 TaxID=2706776 RepID=UPI0013DA7ACA|nr:hypothetical protein [Salipiger sp. PrR003]NDV50151.1 hypothetical protein [Salipiger sp. PrR003]